uniref:Uncharacterized protein n=1 Tax=Ditylenchus dipsaci TaxID=166011 RepID=A0A915CXU9_9BILA
MFSNNFPICSSPGAHGCPQGLALLFPSTGIPVQCSSEGTSTHKCPVNFECVRNTRTGAMQCCSKQVIRSIVSPSSRKLVNRIHGSSHYSRRTAHEFSSRSSRNKCPKYQVQVRRVFKGRIVKRCESKCPRHQVAIRGVCRDLMPDFSPNVRLADLLFQPLNDNSSAITAL